MIRIMNPEEFMKFRKRKTPVPDVSDSVREIIGNVRERGDEAVKEYEKKFDGIELDALEVTPEEIDEALRLTGDEFIALLERAANNIREFHSHQKQNGFMISPKDGVILGQRVIPLKRVGLYVPGGTASYPSSVLMNAIPAKIAGCDEIFIATPPAIKPEIISAAHVAGVNRIFKMGGAQAIAALAYGTESVPRVDKIAGPGNVYVAEAKRQVFGQVSIDMIAGPSEILIIAGYESDASYIAADMLAQAEHDRFATSILLTTSRRLAKNVSAYIESQITKLERHDIARESIDNNGAIVVVRGLNEAVKIANEIAPEHLELCVNSPFDFITENKIRNAGSIFLGHNSPEALGDYYAGANHTLPTMGTARFASPLSVEDFVKKSQYIYYTEDAFRKEAEDIVSFANHEGLTGHAESAAIRTR